MPSERVQRHIDRLLDEADQATQERSWATVRERAHEVLTLDAENGDAQALLALAERGLRGGAPLPEGEGQGEGPPEQPAERLGATTTSPGPLPSPPLRGEGTTASVGAAGSAGASPAGAVPSSFANGRYQVKRFLGEGGKKRVYLAHDTLLDRDVAFALIKTEGLDAAGRDRIRREAQAMGRLGSHPHIVSVFDLGEEADGQPFIVTELMGGGDVEGLIDKASDHRPPLERTLEIGIATCRGLELAHSHGIVHRDLKPGNIWLTADGTAKLGDFGLAVALDRSRLTQAGMMVGTVSYMPPEQALGGEVTPRSDLYSMGAMLYEMVTGRPPFVGNESVAIITQHLNTPPVAPTWHRPDCPPGLEALILRLLEKDPSKRPASAVEVREALSVIDPAAPVAAVSSANPLEGLARGVFVGRERELARLRGAFDRSHAGHGGVAMLVGEPGIGKTRTAQELETYARLRGGQVLWGRAHEAAGAPAYWPWVQALRAYVAVVEPDALRSQLGSGAAEVARVVSELRDRLPDLPAAPPALDPESAQFRLFDAVSTFLRNAASSAPLLLVLDDLHWADRPTLLLLQHVAREIARSRLLILGTYRDVEVGRAHPLAAALAELQREQLFERVLLRGLSREEVEAFIRGSAGVDPARDLVSSIYQETEGNPFFLSEVMALMLEEGTLAQTDRAGGRSIVVPQSVREVLGRRLDRLSPDCNDLLIDAAVLGREFSYGAIAALGEREEQGLLQLIEEALNARVIEETEPAGEYRFSHALIQETLLAELSTTRRVRSQGRVAETLERLYGERAERHAADLALHFMESAVLTHDHAAKAVHYGRLAAEQAEGASAWDEAARHYENCLALLTDRDAGTADEEAALSLDLGRCRRRLGEEDVAATSLLRAIDAYRASGDPRGVARATFEALISTLTLTRERMDAMVEEALAGLGDEEPHLRARLLARRAFTTLMPGVLDETADRARELAAELARAHGFEDVEAELMEVQTHRLMASGDTSGCEASALESIAAFERLGNPERVAHCHVDVALARSAVDLDAGVRATIEALAFARQHHIRRWEWASLFIQAHAALLRGDFSHFDELVAEVDPRSPNLWSAYVNHDRIVRAELAGQFERALELAAFLGTSSNPQAALRAPGSLARALFNSGDEDRAREALRAWADSYQALAVGPIFRIASVTSIDEALPALADDVLVEQVYADSLDWGSPVSPAALNAPRDRLRGALALRLSQIDEAAGYYQAGLGWAERQRCPIEQGRCMQGLADVAERREDHDLAMGLLDRAAAIFQRYGVVPYLRQVLAKKQILKA